MKKKKKRIKGVGQKIVRVGVSKEPGYLYYVDKDGDISRAKMARGWKK